MNSDGNLTFNNGDGASTERSLGRLAGGSPRISALLTDLDPSRAAGSGGVHVLADSARFVVSWDQVPLYSDLGTGVRQRFQVRLYPAGRMEFAYNGITLDSAVVGIAPGALRSPAAVVSFLTDVSGVYSGLIAERFSNTTELDLQAAAQQFYATHEDAYDYLVFYNNMSIPAAAGAVAWESTVRNHRTGYGDAIVDVGRDFGSASRLQGILNLGNLSQFPLDPKGEGRRARVHRRYAAFGGRARAGHLFLAYASIRGSNPRLKPMLGFQSAHWVFNFNSDASLLEGNRIADAGPGTSPRFTTIATVEGYSPLDQYLMGFLRRMRWSHPIRQACSWLPACLRRSHAASASRRQFQWRQARHPPQRVDRGGRTAHARLDRFTAAFPFRFRPNRGGRNPAVGRGDRAGRKLPGEFRSLLRPGDRQPRLCEQPCAEGLRFSAFPASGVIPRDEARRPHSRRDTGRRP